MGITANRQGRLPGNVTIRHDLKPGDIGYLIYLHGILYANEYRWDHTFEAYVGGPLSQFAISHSDRERIWIVEKDGALTGSIAIVENSKEQAQLRWFLLHPDLRGLGLGRLLVTEAIGFCRESGYSSVNLWTIGQLTAAAALYRSVGFKLMEEKTQELWGRESIEQRYDLNL